MVWQLIGMANAGANVYNAYSRPIRTTGTPRHPRRPTRGRHRPRARMPRRPTRASSHPVTYDPYRSQQGGSSSEYDPFRSSSAASGYTPYAGWQSGPPQGPPRPNTSVAMWSYLGPLLVWLASFLFMPSSYGSHGSYRWC
jgi:hypothetical protein